jgi:hypothetical protein
LGALLVLVTQEQIWKKLETLEKKLDKFIIESETASIDEISLNKACRRLRLGRDTVVHLVKTGKLQARIYRDKTRRIRYRFLLNDIKKFQKENKYNYQSFQLEGLETSEEIAKRIFKNKAL